MSNIIKPLPQERGIGWFSFTPHDYLEEAGFRHEQVGIYHNYYPQPDTKYFRAVRPEYPVNWVVDGFSPNVNKPLHVGHLRNLAIARAIQGLTVKLQNIENTISFAALEGWSLPGASDVWAKQVDWWRNFVGYKCKVYKDTELKTISVPMTEGQGDKEGCVVWNEDKDVVLVRSDGRPTYAYHELAFQEAVAPTHIFTGTEQIEHFKSLNLDVFHYPFGLVLGEDGKKMKSRDGEAFLASELMKTLIEKLGVEEYKLELAWNVLCWNFLSAKRTSNVQFDLESWTNPASPGLYITYTYARFAKMIWADEAAVNQPTMLPGGSTPKLEQNDADLITFANYAHYYHNRSIETVDPCPLAQFTLELATKLSQAYESEKFINGREGFVHSIIVAFMLLDSCMDQLGMFRIRKV